VDTTPEEEFGAVIETELLDRYVDEFNDWVNEQDMDDSIFTCDADTRIDHPWPEDPRMTAVWAQ